jgi:hypothetical protein
MKVLGG